MSPRPQAKKSPLAAAGHPAEPWVEPTLQPESPLSSLPESAAADAKTSSATRTTPTKAVKVSEASAKTKVGFYVDSHEASRARGAYRALPRTVTAKSWSDFLAAAVLKETERLEVEYNHGKPFPEAEAGTLPAGRPMGE